MEVSDEITDRTKGAKLKKPKWVVWDTEGDSLNPTKFYCLSYHDVDGQKGTLTDYEDIREFFKKYEWYVAHNSIRWDLVHLERVVGIEVPDGVVDTLALSWYLYPTRTKHGLEAWGEDYGIEKPLVLDWENLKLSTYIRRCEEDVKINLMFWEDALGYLNELYPRGKDLYRFLRYMKFKMDMARLQEESGWKLDVEQVEKNLAELIPLRDEKLEQLKSAMPDVPVYKKYSIPKLRYKKDGTKTSIYERWLGRLHDLGLPEDHEDDIEVLSGYEEANPGSHTQIKDWLHELGWVPRTFKYKRDKETGEIKEIPQINLEHGKGICESIKDLYEKEPRLEYLEGLFVLNHRISILNGFLRDSGGTGWVAARIAGFTNTLRYKHSEVVNLPKPEAAYGEYIRGVLVADEGQILCGSDMSSLNRGLHTEMYVE